MELAATLPQQRMIAQATWPAWQRIAFRWTFCYFMLYSFASLIELTRLHAVWDAYNKFWHTVVPLFADFALNINVSTLPNRSGDTTYNYVEVILFAGIAAVVTVIWSVVDRKRENYDRLFAWFRLFMRMHLGATMIAYGFVKVLPCQFPALDAIRLSQPLGDFQPADLLWAFMGASHPYSMFGGVVEVIAGVLLMIPATALAGAMLTFAVMVNVFLFNMCFDIAVKIFTFHLVLTAALLIAPDAIGLLKLFFLNREFKPVSYAPLFARNKLNRLAVLVQVLYCFYYFGDCMNSTINRYTRLQARSADIHNGIWIVEDETLDGVPVSSGTATALRWGRIAFAGGKSAVVQDATGMRTAYAVRWDGANLTLSDRSRKVGELQLVTTTTSERATIEGEFENHRLFCSLKSLPLTDLALKREPFAWIHEHAYMK